MLLLKLRYEKKKKKHKSLENHVCFEDYVLELVFPLDDMPNPRHQNGLC